MPGQAGAPGRGSQEEILSDGRFSRLARDPRFWEMPERERKVRIDSRFRAMFHDKRFKLRCTVDKRGRPVSYSSTENLRRFYALSESDSELSGGDGGELAARRRKKRKAKGQGGAGSAKGQGGAGSAKGQGGAGSAKGQGGAGSAKGQEGAGSAKGQGGAGSAKGQGGAGSAKSQGGAGSAKGQGEAGSAKSQGGAGSAKGQGEAGSAKGQVGAGSAKGQGEAGSAKGQGEAGSAKGQGEAGSAKGQGGAGSAKGQGEAGSAKGQGGAGSAKGQGGAGSAKGQGEAGSAKSQGEAGSAKGQGEAGAAAAAGLPKGRSKKAKKEVERTCEELTELNDLEKKGEKSKSKLRWEEESREPAVGPPGRGGKQQGAEPGPIQRQDSSARARAAEPLKAARRERPRGGKGGDSATCEQRAECESQPEGEAEWEEEESGAEEEEEQEEDAGETGEDDSDAEDDEDSDSGPDLARGIGNADTSSEEEQDWNELFPEEPQIEHSWRELDKDAPRGEEITSRLAVCNMDWDRLKAKDLLALFNSFTPKGGAVFSVKIYPSEFGKERLKEEEQKGPVELFDLPENTKEDDGIYREKLREYQFKRLKYFYAVVECDSPETANKIYEECDGLEFESSCSFIDLRFIPDNVTFDDKPKDVASEVNIAAYKPKYFTSAAMGTSKVDITWDETDHERVTSLSRTFNKEELLDMDFQAYLASSSEEEEEEQQDGDIANEMEGDKPRKSQKDDEEQIAKYRELLKSIQEKEKKQEEKDIEMEIKWVPGLKETAEEMVKNRLEGKDNLTPWQKYLEKKKEKRILKKKRKAAAEREESEDELPPGVDLNDPYFAEELEKTGPKKKPESAGSTSEDEDEVEKQKAEMALLMMDDEDDSRKHFNYKKIVEQHNLSKKKKKLLMKKKELLEDDFQVNVADTRFQAMFTSPLFNLDPSDPNFKKTKAVEKILEEKARRREEKEQDLQEANKGLEKKVAKKGEVAKKAIDPALSMLIKSVKNKTQEFQARKKQKFK